MLPKSRALILFLGAVVITLSYTTIARVNLGITWRLLSMSGSPQHREMCIADNICKRSSKDAIYYYVRKQNFTDMVDAKIQYGSINNVSHSYPVVPSIVHFIQYSVRGVNTFKFHHMLSVMSARKCIKPDKIYFWIDLEPNSSYWKEVLEKVPEIFLIHREKPRTIRGRRIAGITHVSDIIRIEAILEYGGIYMDLDVIAVKSLDPLRSYDITMGYESNVGLCGGFIMAKPWTEFIRLWHQQYKTFDDNNWGHHAVALPAILAKKYPNLMHTEWKSINRPNWKELHLLYEEGNLYDWRKNNYVCHLWIRFHKQEHNATDIKTWNTTVGELFRYVYYGDWRIKI